MTSPGDPIGFFDSGVGGLSIWRAVHRLLPSEGSVYLADTLNLPYGERAANDVAELAVRGVRFLLAQRCKTVVIACNTASVHGLAAVRAEFPDVPVVGVVPVVKTLARRTRTGSFAVLATPGTAASAYLAGLIAEFAPSATVVTVPCDGLAELVEQGTARGPALTRALEQHLAPVRASDADVLGLGCTHYPFVRPAIKRILGPGVRVYDPSRPVARRVRAVLTERDLLAASDHTPQHRFYTSGDPHHFAAVARRLLRDRTLVATRAEL